jgi:hypothetical protein
LEQPGRSVGVTDLQDVVAVVRIVAAVKREPVVLAGPLLLTWTAMMSTMRRSLVETAMGR